MTLGGPSYTVSCTRAAHAPGGHTRRYRTALHPVRRTHFMCKASHSADFAAWGVLWGSNGPPPGLLFCPGLVLTPSLTRPRRVFPLHGDAIRAAIRKADFDHMRTLGWIKPTEWREVRFGASRAGAVGVPMFTTASIDELVAAPPRDRPGAATQRREGLAFPARRAGEGDGGRHRPAHCVRGESRGVGCARRLSEYPDGLTKKGPIFTRTRDPRGRDP